MVISTMNNKSVFVVLLFFGISFLSLIFYSKENFFYKKIASQNFNPGLTGIMIPQSTIGGTGGGNLYPERIDNFKSELDEILAKNQGFIKGATSEYVLAGQVVGVQKINTNQGLEY